jgi:hypothetical protein
VAGSPPLQIVSVPHSPAATDDQFARAVFRIELSDPSRLEGRLHAYLQTWLALAEASGRPVRAELSQEEAGSSHN